MSSKAIFLRGNRGCSKYKQAKIISKRINISKRLLIIGGGFSHNFAIVNMYVPTNLMHNFSPTFGVDGLQNEKLMIMRKHSLPNHATPCQPSLHKPPSVRSQTLDDCRKTAILAPSGPDLESTVRTVNAEAPFNPSTWLRFATHKPSFLPSGRSDPWGGHMMHHRANPQPYAPSL